MPFSFLQVLSSAWERGLPVAGQNAFSCYDRESFMRIVETAKPRNDPDRHHFAFFSFQQPLPLVERTLCFSELGYFIKCMHGKVSLIVYSICISSMLAASNLLLSIKDPSCRAFWPIMLH